MLRKTLTAAVTLALLFCGATVSLEAVGLLFHVSMPDPQQRVEAFVARLEAELSPVDLPTEPVEILVDVPRDAEQDVSGGEAERPAAAEPAQDSERQAAATQDRLEPDRPGEGLPVAAALAGQVPSLPPQTVAPQPEAEAQEPLGLHPGLQELAPVPAQHPAQLVRRAAEVAPVRPARRRTAGAGRSKPADARTRTRTAGYAAFGCPILDWLVW